MSLELNGKLKVVFDVQTFPSGFSKREFVITTDEQYPQDVKFELVKDKTSLIDKFTVGDQLKVSFNVRGNEYQGKYYVSLGAWRVENIGAAAAPNIPAPLDPMAAQPRAAAAAPAAPIDDIGEDDLPF